MANGHNDNDDINVAETASPDNDVAPVSQDRRSMADTPEPSAEELALVPDHDDGPETFAELAELEKQTRRRGIPPVKWADDKDNPDFAHLLGIEGDGLTPDKTFTLTPDVLELLITSNSFDPQGPDDKFVFALRGALLANGKRQVENAQSVELKDVRPNHRQFRCTIGFYDRANKTITAYLASTVPNVKYMTNYYRKANGLRPYRNIGANMMPTGCYVFRKNAHGGGRIKPAMRMTDPGNLTADAETTILRTKNDLTFRHNDYWQQTTPYDNIHCAYSTTSFSSAGCQTICGKNRQGPWGRFQKELDKLKWNTRMDYMLLTGREAGIAAKILETAPPNKDILIKKYLRRLRVGSYGPAVSAIQIKMGYTGKTKYFGPSTRSRLVEYERNAGIASDSIYSYADDEALRWNAFAAAAVPPPAPTQPPAGPSGPSGPPVAGTPKLVPDTLRFIEGPQGSELSADNKSLNVPGMGTWSIGPVPGKVTFTPVAGYAGMLPPVTYRIMDESGGSATATINVTVQNINKAPVVEDDTVRTVANKPVNIAILANDADTDGRIIPTSVRLVSAPSASHLTADGKSLAVFGKGTWTVDPQTGNVRFSPLAGFTGTTHTAYEITDDKGSKARGKITVVVSAAEAAPADPAQPETNGPVTVDVTDEDAPAPTPVTPTTPSTPTSPTPTDGGTTTPVTPGPVTPQAPRIEGAVQISEAQLRRFAPRAKEKYIRAIVDHGEQILYEHGINTNAMRLSHFLAQIGHESGGFTIDRESLYYTSAKRIRQVWPSRFPSVSYASQFVRNEKKLAMKVYDNRVRDLGNTQPGDGYVYRGRGLIQITGRGNYADMGRKLNIDLEGKPDLATDGLTALRIAAQTWTDRTRKQRTMNQLADDNKIDIITVRINGGYTNLSHRKSEFERAWKIWGTGGAPRAVKNPDIIERGDRGERVKVVQRLLVQKGYFPANETIDGVYGGNTQRTVARFQHTYNQTAAGRDKLNVNGMVDKRTLKALQGAPDAERRKPGRPPRNARDPRALEQARRGARDRRYDRREVPETSSWPPLLRLLAVVLIVLAIAIPFIAGIDIADNTPGRRDGTRDILGPLSSYLFGSGGLAALSVILFGVSGYRTRQNQGGGHVPSYPSDIDSVGSYPTAGPPVGGGSQAAVNESDAPDILDDIAYPDEPYVESDNSDTEVLGANAPLHQYGFSEADFADQDPIRHAPGLPEDIETFGDVVEEEPALPELSPEDTLEEPGAPDERNAYGATDVLTPVAFDQVSTRDVDLAVIKMFGGDNNLSHQVDNDLQEMAAGIRNGNANIAVLGLADYENAPASVVEVSPSGQIQVISNLGEIDTGDPETLAKFLSRALVTYPKARKAIGFWDHGTGVFEEDDENEKLLTRSHRTLKPRRGYPARRLLIPASQREQLMANPNTRGMLHDNTGGILTNVEAGRMLQAAFHRAGQHSAIDLLYSDTCLNGMIEVLEELGEFAHCVVASSDTEPGAGWDYEQWFQAVADDFPQTPDHWGQRAVRAFSRRYREDIDEHPCTLAAFKADNSITDAFANLVEAADSTDPKMKGWFFMSHARSRAQSYDHRDAYDLIDFAQRLNAVATNREPEIAAAAAELDRVCRAARIDFAAHGQMVSASQGLAFWFPSSRRNLETDVATYRKLKFAQATGWADYLEQCYTGAVS